ncbi:MAG: choice-of-anchor J domain-containing protein, partial [Dysgonamonadaceae bacterium]|nr:choice-of-anchor J domain-containing protein [Dysgonamonadaceae bacterium]
MKKLFLFLSLTLFFVGSLSAKDLPVASQKQVVKAALTAHVDKPSKDLSKVSPLLQKRLDTAEQTLRTKGVKQHSRFESSPTQQVVYLGRRAQTDATTASITLKAGNPWGDGTGYVLWISNNLTFDMVDATYDEVTEDYNWATIYGYCNYFIPTTATGSPTTPKVGGNSGTPSATITIPGGTYAYLVLNPDPTSNTMFIPGAGPAYDFTYNFQNGWEYLFEITADPTYGDKVNLTATHPLPPGFTYTLPFTDNFSESYANKWTITDANSDGKTWTQVTDGSVGAMRYSYNSSQNANDYLITNAPVTIPAGENTFKLSYRAQSSSYPEAFEIYYGTSNAPASFTKIGGVSDIKNTTYEEYITAVNLPAGDYYFAIKATSAKDMFYLYITDVSITAGAFVALPDLSISKIVLPQASCTLSNAESISLVVANTGLAASTSYTINYTVNGVNGSQTVAGGLAAKSTATVALNSTFDFSALTTYNITASVTDPADTNTENNSASVSLTTHGPLTLPFSNHLESEADIADFYFDEDTWVYFNTGGFKDLTAYEESPLYTRCIQMNSGVYNLKFGYMAGMNFFGYLFTDDFEVRFGKAGTDVSTWQVIASFEEEYTDDAYVNYETTLTVSSADLYQVAFVPTWLGALAIESIEITAALDHDVAVQSVTSTLAAYTPVSHLNGNTVEFSVGIKNTGKNNETVKVQVLQGATVLGEVSQTVNAGATATVKVP